MYKRQDYKGTFTCSTVGALGGAVFMSAFGWAPVSRMLLIRLAYVIAGIVIAYAANCLLFPYHRSTAAGTLLKKYDFASKLLSKLCSQGVTDTQFYYHLVIQSQLIEEKPVSYTHLDVYKRQCIDRTVSIVISQ